MTLSLKNAAALWLALGPIAHVSVVFAQADEAALYPMPYVSEDVPERYREPVATPSPAAPELTTPTVALPDANNESPGELPIGREAASNQTPTRAVVDWGVDVGFSDHSDAHVARVIGAVSGRLTRQLELRLRVPMLVADVGLTRPETNEPTRASTFRFGNVTLGAAHEIDVTEARLTYGIDLVLPSAIGATDQDDEHPTLERQLSTRAYDLAAAIDGMRAAWLFRQNTVGFVAHGAAERVEGPWLLGAALDFAVIPPVRDELNGEVILQLDGSAGRRVGPVVFAVRGSVVLLAAVGLTIPSITPSVGVTDGGNRLWSLRATFADSPGQLNVAPWGISLAVGGALQ